MPNEQAAEELKELGFTLVVAEEDGRTVYCARPVHALVTNSRMHVVQMPSIANACDSDAPAELHAMCLESVLKAARSWRAENVGVEVR